MLKMGVFNCCRLTKVPLRAMCAPAVRTRARVTLPKLPSPISFKTSNLSSRHMADIGPWEEVRGGNSGLNVMSRQGPRRCSPVFHLPIILFLARSSGADDAAPDLFNERNASGDCLLGLQLMLRGNSGDPRSLKSVEEGDFATTDRTDMTVYS